MPTIVVEMNGQLYGPFETAELAYYWLNANADPARRLGTKGLVRTLNRV